MEIEEDKHFYFSPFHPHTSIIIIVCFIFTFVFFHTKGKQTAEMRAYATYDPRKGTHVAGNGGDHPYQEIPYGDGPGPRGPIPEVPQHYAQVPPPPQRQGMLAGSISPLLSCAKRRRFGSLRSLVQLPKDANLIWLVSPDSGRQSCEVCPPRSRDNICTTSLSIVCH